MIINGKIVTVPSSDFKFLIKENSVVVLQQTNLEDNIRIYYSGTKKLSVILAARSILYV